MSKLESNAASILLVDDRPENLLALEIALGDQGHNLVKANSGGAALRCVLQQDFAAILLDVQMPEMDGFETAALIRARERSRHTPIIFITAIGKSEPEVFKGYSVGAVDYVFKPFVADILKAKVNVFVDLYRMRRQIEEQAGQLARANDDLARHAIEVEALNHELEAFSYSVSHDLRAPLRAISGFSESLLEDYAGKLDAGGQDYLQRIRAAAMRMNQLIDDLLRLSRVTSADLTREPVDLSALARAVAAELQQTQPERAVEFVIADDLAATGDAKLLRAVLDNLLGNAWKFTGKRPTARIEFGQAEASATPAIRERPAAGAAPRMVYFVRDDGAGFDPAFAAKLFTPFQRLHRESEFAGTGIGLATVQRIIRRHGGTIWAEGAVEKGATFYFTLGEA